MFKKLDILVIKAFIGPFIATFFITLFVLIIQFFWLFIDDFVGKGLDPKIILQFILYKGTSLVPLALPLSVLLSSLMTFGNLGETYELVAIKAAGISLLRFMRPLFVVTLGICGLAFLFANNVIPVANLKSETMLRDIVKANPSFDLKEGVFFDKIPRFAIKVGKKEQDTIIKNVIIYEENNNLQDNFIIATDGIMRLSDNRQFLEFILHNGWRYEERGNAGSPNSELIRLGFKEYKKQFDISVFGLQKMTNDSVNRENAKMLSMRQLEVSIDSIRRNNERVYQQSLKNTFAGVAFAANLDSSWKTKMPSKAAYKNFDKAVPDSIKEIVRQGVSSKLSGLRTNNDYAISSGKDLERNLNIHKIEWHRKIVLSIACLVLFLIGAPLGSIIRKGGLGSPLIFAIVFFMLFYFSTTTGEKFAKEGSWSVFSGMWLSTFILLPIGFFLIYKAMRDSEVFNKEYYYRLLKKIRDRKKVPAVKAEPEVAEPEAEG